MCGWCPAAVPVGVALSLHGLGWWLGSHPVPLGKTGLGWWGFARQRVAVAAVLRTH